MEKFEKYFVPSEMSEYSLVNEGGSVYLQLSKDVSAIDAIKILRIIISSANYDLDYIKASSPRYIYLNFKQGYTGAASKDYVYFYSKKTGDSLGDCYNVLSDVITVTPPNTTINV